jgi:tetratricopeptide (TPR) repeat protein
LAIFGFGKKGDADKTPSSAGGGKGAEPPKDKDKGGGFEFDGTKAEKFFERAVTLHEATNFGFAMNLWLRGLRFDPGSMRGVEGFFKSAGAYFNENPKGEKESGYRDTVKEFSGRSDLDRYLLAMLEWSAHATDGYYAVKALKAASDLGLGGPAVWMAERAVGAISREKKPRKDQFVEVMEVFKKFDRLDKAVEVGEVAVRLDPTDGRLASDVKNMSAEWATRQGGFDQTGKEGGFRANIRDADKQRQMEEAQRVVSTEEQLDRLVAAARADHEASPNDRSNAIKYIDVLLRRANPEDEEAAFAVASTWFEKSKEYRFRETMDTIRVKQARRKAARLKGLAEQPGATDEAKDSYKAAMKERIVLELRSLEGQVEAYPTDLTRKFELAKLYFQVKKYEEAIGLLQEAKEDGKNRAQVYFYLGLAFQAIGLNDEAIETLRMAMTMQSPTDEKGVMELQYSLMEALLARGVEQTTIGDVEEANKLASQITMKNFNFKQIGAKRSEIKAALAKLKGGTPGPATA